MGCVEVWKCSKVGKLSSQARRKEKTMHRFLSNGWRKLVWEDTVYQEQPYVLVRL